MCGAASCGAAAGRQAGRRRAEDPSPRGTRRQATAAQGGRLHAAQRQTPLRARRLRESVRVRVRVAVRRARRLRIRVGDRLQN